MLVCLPSGFKAILIWQALKRKRRFSLWHKNFPMFGDFSTEKQNLILGKQKQEEDICIIF